MSSHALVLSFCSCRVNRRNIRYLFKNIPPKRFAHNYQLFVYHLQFQTRPRPGKLSVERIYEVSFLPTEPGILTCIAQNIIDGKERRTLTKAHVLLGNVSENMTIYGFDKDHKIAKEDNVNFTCEALAYHFDGNLKWFINGEDLKESDCKSL